MKYNNPLFLQVPYNLLDYDICPSEIAIYLALKGFERQYCNKEKHTFTVSDKRLSKAAHISMRTIQTYKNHLEQLGLIQVGREHLEFELNGSKSKIGYTKYFLPILPLRIEDEEQQQDDYY